MIGYALRLLLDPTLPDSARHLALSDFWGGLTAPAADNLIAIAVELSDFEEDLDELALLTDYRLENDAHRARLVWLFADKTLEKSAGGRGGALEWSAAGGKSGSEPSALELTTTRNSEAAESVSS